VKIGGVLVTMLCFTDDKVVLATSEEDLQAALRHPVSMPFCPQKYTLRE